MSTRRYVEPLADVLPEGIVKYKGVVIVSLPPKYPITELSDDLLCT